MSNAFPSLAGNSYVFGQSLREKELLLHLVATLMACSNDNQWRVLVAPNFWSVYLQLFNVETTVFGAQSGVILWVPLSNYISAMKLLESHHYYGYPLRLRYRLYCIGASWAAGIFLSG